MQSNLLGELVVQAAAPEKTGETAKVLNGVPLPVYAGFITRAMACTTLAKLDSDSPS